MDTVVKAKEIDPPTTTGHLATAAGVSKKKLEDIDEAPKKHFPTGVMAGDAETEGSPAASSRAVLWTRYTGGKQLSVRVLETHPKPGRRPPGIAKDQVVEVKDGFVHFEARGLTPGARYEYVFLEKSAGGKEARSPVGHFRAPIRPNARKPVVFGGTSCTFPLDERLKMANRNLQHAASKRRKLSFFVHLGDQLYCDAPKEKPAATLPAFRAKYRHAFSRPGIHAMHKAFGMYTTWDDHEVFNGWQGDLDTEGKHDVNDVIKKKSNIQQIIDWGEQSFYQHQPIRKPNREQRKLWRRFRWGETLELFILDCRAERDNKNGRYISAEQEEALIKFLTDPNGAVFKFVLNSRPIGYLGKRRPATFPPKKKPEPKEDYSWTHPSVVEQRERILAAARMSHGVWWLSGDLHFGAIGWVDPGKPKPGEKRVGEIMMGPGGQWASKPGTEKRKLKKEFIRKLGDKKHMTFATLKSNYVVIHVNPAKKAKDATLDIYFHHKTRKGAKVLHHEKRSYTGRVLKKPGASQNQGGSQG
ncbi:MAG TPA: alkaline phosphatase D family protein [Polyangiaceae bacterium]|nr:alkaline phosphatase D family protein [Polyangiaceae bacterium]